MSVDIRQRLLSWDIVLTEDPAPCCARQALRSALQAPTQPIPVMIGMPALHLFEHRDRPQAEMRLEQRADLAGS